MIVYFVTAEVSKLILSERLPVLPHLDVALVFIGQENQFNQVRVVSRCDDTRMCLAVNHPRRDFLEIRMPVSILDLVPRSWIRKQYN